MYVHYSRAGGRCAPGVRERRGGHSRDASGIIEAGPGCGGPAGFSGANRWGATVLQAVTIDFHDTLFICDDWFQLEIRGLLPAFLRWRAERDRTEVDDALLAQAEARYRVLRQQVMANGAEVDAVAAVVSVTADLGVPATLDEAEAGVELLMYETLGTARPRPGAVELAQELKAAGLRLGVVSSAAYHPFLEWSMERYGLRDAFDDVTTSASCGIYKTRPEIYHHALAALEVPAERAVHVGDSYRFDVLAARRAGMSTVWLDLAQEAVPGHQADLVVDDLAGLAQRILERF